MNILQDHLLAPYSAYQIGGKSDYFLEAKTNEEILEGLRFAEEKGLKVFMLGGGTNLLFDDDGFRGLVIRVKAEGLRVEEGDGGGDDDMGTGRIFADAGVSMAKVVNLALENGLTGLESWNGLPGTVGGAVRGNAGCFGVEVKDVLDSAVIFMPGQGVKEFLAKELEFAYRSSIVKRNPAMVVLSAVFRLKKGDKGLIKAKMIEVAKSRILKQPAGASCGSFFKNPEGDSAGRLIEACGLKGTSMGGAKVSEAHGNFILNTGGARAKDIEELASKIEKNVFEKFGIKLEREVAVVK